MRNYCVVEVYPTPIFPTTTLSLLLYSMMLQIGRLLYPDPSILPLPFTHCCSPSKPDTPPPNPGHHRPKPDDVTATLSAADMRKQQLALQLFGPPTGYPVKSEKEGSIKSEKEGLPTNRNRDLSSRIKHPEKAWSDLAVLGDGIVVVLCCCFSFLFCIRLG